MKKTNWKIWLLSALLCACVVLALMPGIAVSASAADDLTVTIDTGVSVTLKDSDGNGYYEIGTADELYAFAALVNGGNNTINGILTADITVNERVLVDGELNSDTGAFRAWTPIGVSGMSFNGNFDGNGKTVSGLYCSVQKSSDVYVGMFGDVFKGSIRNLTVDDSWFYAEVKHSTIYAGGVVGQLYSSTMDSVRFSGVITAKGIADWSSYKSYTYVGGAVGDAYNSTLSNVVSEASIRTSGSGTYAGSRYYLNAGGVCGYAQNGSISNAVNLGTVADSSEAGYEIYIGGLLGRSLNCTVENSRNEGTITGSCQRSEVGGLVALNGGTLNRSVNYGKISSGDYAGGLICVNYGGTVTDCYNLGEVSAARSAAGIATVHYMNSVMTNCFNMGKVTSSDEAYGAIYNYNNATLSGCYYLADAEDDRYAETTAMTAEQFASGQVAYLLNGSVSGGTGWYQTLGEDPHPVWDSTHGIVYRSGACDADDATYSNTVPTDTTPVHSYKNNGFCACGLAEPGTPVTNENYETLGLTAEYVGWYAISNAGQLHWLSQHINNGYATANAVLLNDITDNPGTMSEASSNVRSWIPIGFYGDSFGGTFDGRGHTIRGLHCSMTEGYYAGFIAESSGTVKNVTIADSWFYSTSARCIGAMVGNNSGTVSNCFNFSPVAADGSGDRVGGIVGENRGTVINCGNAGTVTGTSFFVGGIAGLSDTNIVDCYNTAAISGEYAGGIVGYFGHQSGGTNMTDCYNTGAISGTYVGALVGAYESTAYGSCYNSYYLMGTADTAIGGRFETDSSLKKTESAFSSGEVAYLLGDGWGQAIGSDEYPVLGGQKVYYGYVSCGTDAEKTYSNDAIGGVKPDHVGEATCSKLAVCENCYEEFGSLNADNHAGNTNTTFTSDGDKTHSLICSECYQPFNTGTHEGGTATCAQKAVCDICSASYGNLDYDNHTGEYTVEYDWNLYGDGTCYVNATLRCADCKGYIDSNSGDAQLVESVEAADCRNPGSVTYSVTLILNGKEYTGTETFEVKSDNHVGQWKDGFCTACGGYQKPTVDPGEDPEWDYDDVYLIYNAGQLFWFADHVNNVKNDIAGKLMANIDLNPGFTFNADGSYSFNGIEGPFAGGIAGLEPPRMWTPIGSGSPCYAGNFDGNGFTVSGVYAVSDGRYVGLFGNTDYNYEIKNLGITNSYLKGADHVGGLIGYAYTVVKNCFVTDTVYVSGSYSTAAFIGYNGGEVCNSYAMADSFVDTNYGSCYNCYALTEGDGITAVTAEDFISGKAAYLLQQGVTEEGCYDENDEWVTYIPEIWGQTIGEDAYPVLGGAKVYQITDCKGNLAYSNTDVSGEHRDTDNNSRCDICDCVMESAKPVMKGTAFSLSFEEEILVNFYYTVSDMTYVEEHGMLVFYSAPGTADFSKADAVYHKSMGDSVEAYYGISTAGIAAREMGDTRYYVAYAKLSDGTYVYSDIYGYSPKQYAMNMLGKASTSEGQKALCVALLNFGAAAQEYFGDKVNDLMNAELTDAQKALVIPYDRNLFTGAVEADEAKIGAFAATATGFSEKGVSVSLEGAFSMNYYFTPDTAMSGDMTLYIWTPEAYAAADTLTADNASETVTMVVTSLDNYWGTVSGIAAKCLDDTYYVAGVYADADGNTYCTGVIAYSLSKYCINKAANGSNMQQLASATAMYGYYAKLYFTN